MCKPMNNNQFQMHYQGKAQAISKWPNPCIISRSSYSSDLTVYVYVYWTVVNENLILQILSSNLQKAWTWFIIPTGSSYQWKTQETFKICTQNAYKHICRASPTRHGFFSLSILLFIMINGYKTWPTFYWHFPA